MNLTVTKVTDLNGTILGYEINVAGDTYFSAKSWDDGKLKIGKFPPPAPTSPTEARPQEHTIVYDEREALKR